MKFLQGIEGIDFQPFAKWGTLFLTVIFFFFSSSAFAQKSKKDLEDRRKTLLKEIESTNRLLENTRQSKKTTTNRYYALQNQIEKRQELITTLREEIHLSQSVIERTDEVIEALGSDIEKLKSEYRLMARSAYRSKLKNNRLAFLLSSKNLNDAFQRWHYLRQYNTYRQNQTKLILETQWELSAKAHLLEQKKAEKATLLSSEYSQKNILEHELSDSDQLLDKLKEDESALVADLNAKKKAHEDLNHAIEKLILEAVERAKRETRAPAPASSGSTAKAVPSERSENVALSENFALNRGKLPWPVSSGVITRNFGTQQHPVLKNIKTTNNGIDIQTNENAAVQAVFEGEVAGMQFIPGNNYMLIIRHGNFFSVYSNLEEVAVKRGDKISTKQMVGTVGIDRVSNQPELHFEIWQEKALQNPVLWLARN